MKGQIKNIYIKKSHIKHAPACEATIVFEQNVRLENALFFFFFYIKKMPFFDVTMIVSSALLSYNDTCCEGMTWLRYIIFFSSISLDFRARTGK